MSNWDVKKILQDVGITITGEGEREYYALCPIHNDNTASLTINKKKGTWWCFAGCGGGADIVSFLVIVTGQPDHKVRYQLYSGYIKPVTNDDILDYLKPKEEKKVAFDTSLFSQFSTKYPRWFFDRGFDISDVNDWNLLGDSRNSSLIIPAYDDRNTCLGYITRIAPSRVSNLGYKYVLSEGLDKTDFLFGYNLVKRKSLQYNSRQVWICEGNFDAMWLQKHGKPAVALLGIYMTDKHVQILKRDGIEEIVLIMDNDENTDPLRPKAKKGKEATKDLIKKLFMDFKLYEFVYPDESIKDPQELTAEQINNAQLKPVTLET